MNIQVTEDSEIEKTERSDTTNIQYSIVNLVPDVNTNRQSNFR